MPSLVEVVQKVEVKVDKTYGRTCDIVDDPYWHRKKDRNNFIFHLLETFFLKTVCLVWFCQITKTQEY